MDDLTFDEARELAARWPDLDADELDMLKAWVRDQMAGYVKGCLDGGWVWNAEDDADREEMSGWIGDDLSIDEDSNVAESICKAAGWPS